MKTLYALPFFLIVTMPGFQAVGADESGFQFYVSTKGDDAAAGSRQHPVATLEKARELVREAKERADGKPVTVWVSGGEYFPAEGFELNALDSGSVEAPVAWRAMPDEVPRIVGAKKIAATEFKPVTDPEILARMQEAAREKVLEVRVAASGIDTINSFPDVFVGNGGLFQLFQGGKKMRNAQWPNEGYTTMQEVLNSGIKPEPRGGTFVFRGDRPSRWTKALEENELWLAGFWRVPWVIQAIRVEKMDLEKNTMTFAASIPLGIGSKYTKEIDGTRKGSGQENYYAMNLVEELDQPGEWCYRFATGMLYFWPEQPVADSEVLVADSLKPTISLKLASHVVLRGLQVEGSLATAISINGGVGCKVVDCTVTDTAGEAIRISGGTRHEVRGCDLYDLGAGGIDVEGGDRTSLTPAEHLIENNHIHHIGGVTKIVNGITVRGVGIRVRHNLVHDTPNSGILYAGNDHLFELNELHNIGLDSGDLGAFYTTADWTSRGNIVRHNFIHHSPAANGVYLDDGDCGDEVTGNVFYRAQCGPFVSGGLDNLVRHNLIMECAKGIHIDDRGVARGYNQKNPTYMKKLAAVDYKNSPWSTRYPALVGILELNTELPIGTVLENNVLVGCPKPMDLAMKEPALEVVRVSGNLEMDAPLRCADYAGMDFTLPDDSELFGKVPGFKPIPFKSMGLYADEYRLKVPTRAETGGTEERARAIIFNSETDMKRSNEIESQRKP